MHTDTPISTMGVSGAIDYLTEPNDGWLTVPPTPHHPRHISTPCTSRTPPTTPVHCSESRSWARGVVEIHVRGKNLLEALVKVSRPQVLHKTSSIFVVIAKLESRANIRRALVLLWD